MAIAEAGSAATETPREERYEVRKIGSAEIWESLSQGWDDFKDKRGDLIVIGLIYPLVGLAAAFLFMGGNLYHFFFPVAAGVSLLGPVAAVGFYELARRREDGLESDWSHFLDVRKRPAWGSIMAVAGLLLVIFLAWLFAAGILWSVLLGPPAVSIEDMFSRMFGSVEGWMLIVVGNVVGACFAALVLAVSVVSMPMLVDCDVDARTAVDTSVRAVMANKWAFVRWGVIVAALLVIGSIPLFVGLAVVLPVLGYATWHIYSHAVVRRP